MTSDKEPTFKLEIRYCYFKKLSLAHLTEKLNYMRKLNLTKYYTIVEDTDTIYESNPKTEEKK
jgi:hypothetical protein